MKQSIFQDLINFIESQTLNQTQLNSFIDHVSNEKKQKMVDLQMQLEDLHQEYIQIDKNYHETIRLYQYKLDLQLENSHIQHMEINKIYSVRKGLYNFRYSVVFQNTDQNYIRIDINTMIQKMKDFKMNFCKNKIKIEEDINRIQKNVKNIYKSIHFYTVLKMDVSYEAIKFCKSKRSGVCAFFAAVEKTLFLRDSL